MANSNWGVTVSGFDALRAKLNKLGDMKALEPAMRESLKVLQQEASRFPPQPSRTRAKTFNTWVREVGRLPMSAFFGAGGAARKRIVTGKITGSETIKLRQGASMTRSIRSGVLEASDMLLKRWKSAAPQIRIGANYIIGRISNDAKYAQFVQGERQPEFHAQTGWKKTSEIQRMHAKRIAAIFERMMKGIAG